MNYLNLSVAIILIGAAIVDVIHSNYVNAFINVSAGCVNIGMSLL